MSDSCWHGNRMISKDDEMKSQTKRTHINSLMQILTNNTNQLGSIGNTFMYFKCISQCCCRFGRSFNPIILKVWGESLFYTFFGEIRSKSFLWVVWSALFECAVNFFVFSRCYCVFVFVIFHFSLFFSVCFVCPLPFFPSLHKMKIDKKWMSHHENKQHTKDITFETTRNTLAGVEQGCRWWWRQRQRKINSILLCDATLSWSNSFLVVFLHFFATL